MQIREFSVKGRCKKKNGTLNICCSHRAGLNRWVAMDRGNRMIHADCMGGNGGFPPLFRFFSTSPSTKVIKSKIAVGRHDLMKLFDWDLPLYWSPALCLQPAVFKFVQNIVVQTMLIFMRCSRFWELRVLITKLVAHARRYIGRY